ncbi:MAG TPA: type IV toxin-antitoxin system AbiEi family antitoxin domain-containing protein [Iamia sp.]
MDRWAELMDRVERAHGVVTTQDLIAAGLSRGQVETLVHDRRLTSLGVGTWRVRGAPDTREARVLGAILGLEGDVWASHRTAAWLHGIRVHGPAGLIEVTRPYGASANRGAVHIHRSTLVPSHHVTTVREIPVTTVPRTVFDLARRTGAKVLDRAIEEALRGDLCTIGSLHRVLAELGGQGRPGTRKMRAALATRDADYVPTSSELTAVGRAVFGCIPGIEWEVPLFDAQGYIRRVDAFVRWARLVIEFDGARFHDQPSDIAADTGQDNRLIAIGIIVERCRWVDLTRRPEVLLAKIMRLIEGGAA